MDPVAILTSHLNYHETGVNCNLFSHYLGHPCEAWCGDTVTACYEMSGHKLPSMQPGCDTGYASVYYGFTWAQHNGLVVPSWDAERNDAVCFQWDGAGLHGNPDHMHTAFVIASGPKGTTLHYMGGNQHDQVSEQTITVGSNLIMGVIKLSKFLATPVPTHVAPAPKPAPSPKPKPVVTPHAPKLALPTWDPHWPVYMVKTPLMTGKPVEAWQARMVQRGWHKVPANTPYSAHAGQTFVVDGKYGDDTAAVAWAFQHDKGLIMDGKLGYQTWLTASREDNVTAH